MMNQRELRRAVRHKERELRAAGGDMLGQLRPRNILRDARDLAIKFVRDDVLQAYVAPRVWAVLAVVLVFVLVGTVCAIDVMIKAGRFVPGIVALLAGAAVWAGGVAGQIYVFAIWLEERAAQRDRDKPATHAPCAASSFIRLGLRRALVRWILSFRRMAVPCPPTSS